MKKFLFITFIFLSLLNFGEKIALIENNDIIFKEVELKNSSVEYLFEFLSSFENSLVPKDVLNAYYFVDTSLIIDLNSSLIQNFSAEDEVLFLLQILYTLFENVKGIDRIYIIVDGKQTNLLVKYINIYFSFPRELYKIPD
ncbi:GerMN domain-containing protein [Thermosipho atlanticus]|uniref:Sporulation and spore germination n=1 Tax=Thermosipho atlanticus DSM 15807 TaxID=1123380 RepID=A0A1M5SQR3_9BACT|nr:GerMN domain-containing protein [Thermosipho atlanticus]SHH40914.1 Sporulation and spore germination [Thermosipho atlanticus DSM 15807]